jgi:Bacterial Ig-like domain
MCKVINRGIVVFQLVNGVFGGCMNQVFRKFSYVFASLLLTLLVACPPSSGVTPDFGLTLGSSSVSIKRTQAGTVTINLSKIGSFQDSVALSLENAPAGVTGSFNPASTTSSSTLNLSVALAAALGDTTLTVKGVSVTSTKTATFKLTVTAAPTTGDITPPTVVSTLAKSNTSVEVVFDEAIVGGTVASNFSFPSQGLNVTAASVAADNKTVTLTTSPQTATSYALLVSSSLTDVAGNTYDLAKQPANKTTFQGIAAGPTDTTAPFVLSTTASTNTSVTVVFSEQINGGNVAANFSFPGGQGLSVNAASIGANGTTVTLTTSPQTAGTPYGLFVSTNITDLAGNPYIFPNSSEGSLARNFNGHN